MCFIEGPLGFNISMVFHEDICVFNKRKEQRFYGHGFVSNQQINDFLQIDIFPELIAFIHNMTWHFPSTTWQPRMKSTFISQRKWHFPEKRSFSVPYAHFLCSLRFFGSQISSKFCYFGHFFIKSTRRRGISPPELALQSVQT